MMIIIKKILNPKNILVVCLIIVIILSIIIIKNNPFQSLNNNDVFSHQKAQVFDSGNYTFYISPNGSDENAGTESSPWLTFSFAINKLNPGNTLVLLDGTYAPETTGMPFVDCAADGNAKNGASDQTITIKAQNERKADLNSRGVNYWGSFHIQNCTYWNLEGLRGEAGDNPASNNDSYGNVFSIKNSSYINMRRMLGAYNDRYQNSHIYFIENSKNILIEESEAYYYHRHAFSVWKSHDVVIRRSYANSRAYADLPNCSDSMTVGVPRCSSNPSGGDSSYVFYFSSNSIVENSISENHSYGFNVIGGITYDGLPGGNNNRFLGDISIRDSMAAKIQARKDADSGSYWEAKNNEIENFLVVNNGTSAVIDLSSAFNSILNHVTTIGSSANLGIIAEEDSSARCADTPSGCSTTIRNSIAKNNARQGFYGADQNRGFLVEYSNSFNNSNGIKANQYFPIETNGDSAGDIRNSLSVDPVGIGADACLVFVPQGSNMKGAGKNGEDIGANILYKYQDGVLTSNQLWNASSGSFPCGSSVSGINDVAGESCFDVNKRLNVNYNGCYLPYSNTPSSFVAPVELTSTVSTTAGNQNNSNQQTQNQVQTQTPNLVPPPPVPMTIIPPVVIVASTTNKIVTPVYVSVVLPTFISSTLSFGSRGAQVKLLQQVLVKEKLLTPNLATGYYGTLTELAVKNLQKKYNIVSSGTPKTTGYGVVGKKTIVLVNALNTNSSTTPNPSTSLGVNNQTTTSGSKITTNLSIGSRNPQVKTLQTILVQQNLLSPKYVTGYYGPITQTAVQKLQSKYNVVSTGTPKTTGYGVVGPKTRKVVNSI